MFAQLNNFCERNLATPKQLIIAILMTSFGALVLILAFTQGVLVKFLVLGSAIVFLAITLKKYLRSDLVIIKKYIRLKASGKFAERHSDLTGNVFYIWIDGGVHASHAKEAFLQYASDNDLSLILFDDNVFDDIPQVYIAELLREYLIRSEDLTWKERNKVMISVLTMFSKLQKRALKSELKEVFHEHLKDYLEATEQSKFIAAMLTHQYSNNFNTNFLQVITRLPNNEKYGVFTSFKEKFIRVRRTTFIQFLGERAAYYDKYFTKHANHYLSEQFSKEDYTALVIKSLSDFDIKVIIAITDSQIRRRALQFLLSETERTIHALVTNDLVSFEEKAHLVIMFLKNASSSYARLSDNDKSIIVSIICKMMHTLYIRKSVEVLQKINLNALDTNLVSHVQVRLGPDSIRKIEKLSMKLLFVCADSVPA